MAPRPTAAAAFVENRGQWDARARFASRRGPLAAWFERGGWVVALRGPSRSVAVRMSFAGPPLGEPVGERALLSSRSYFLGSNPDRWTAGVRSHARLRYEGVRAGVDVVVRGGGDLFAYDVHVGPGADLGELAIRCEGVDGLAIGSDGSLVMQTALGPIRQSPPVAWQESRARRPATCRFVLRGDRTYGFAVPDRDPALPLVIDPDLTWSTYLGGSDTDQVWGVATDGTVVTVAGHTESANYPVTMGAYQVAKVGQNDVFVSRLDPRRPPGEQLVWSTLLGGSDHDVAFDMAESASGVVTVAGFTQSADFPTIDGSYDTVHSGGMDAFVARLDPRRPGRQQLVWSTFLGAAGDEFACALDVDADLVVTVAGYTQSPGFPTRNAYQPGYGGVQDVFVTRLDPRLSGAAQLRSSTFLGGSIEEGPNGTLWQQLQLYHVKILGLDRNAAGQIAVAGCTASSDYPLVSPFQSNLASTQDAFVSVLSPDLSALLYSTYLGGSQVDAGMGIALGPGILAVDGLAYSPDFPTTAGSFNPVHSVRRDDAFVTYLDFRRKGAAQLFYSTFLGGPDYNFASALDVDSRAIATLVGSCRLGFPTTAGAWDTTHNGEVDAFVARLAPDGRGKDDLLYSTYVGGSAIDRAFALAPDGRGGVFAGGVSMSSDFPTTAGAFQTVSGGGDDAVVFHLDLLPTGVTRGCGSAPHCGGPILFEVDRMPLAGSAFSLLIGNAPPSAAGVMLLGAPLAACQPPLLGALLGVNPVVQLPLAGVASGTHELRLVTRPEWAGVRFGAQTVFLESQACAGAEALASSASLDVVLQ